MSLQKKNNYNSKLRAVCICKNEVDIIQETLLHAKQFCDEIYVYDLGSSDGTIEAVKEIEDNIINLFDTVDVVYHDGRHADVWRSLWNSDSNQFKSSDWYMILDADEQMVMDPRKVLFSTSYKKVNLQMTKQICFYFTDEDYCNWKKGDRRSVQERLRYFYIGGYENRFFRCLPGDKWPSEQSEAFPNGCRIPLNCTYPGWKIIFNRHYQYRTPDQIKKRFLTRDANKKKGGLFGPQWKNRSLEGTIRASNECRMWDDNKYYSNFTYRELVLFFKHSFRVFLSLNKRLFITKQGK